MKPRHGKATGLTLFLLLRCCLPPGPSSSVDFLFAALAWSMSRAAEWAELSPGVAERVGDCACEWDEC